MESNFSGGKMRFFWTGKIKNSKPISFAISFFLLFLLLFWFGNILNFWFKFKFSVEEISNYLFGDPEFPSEISPAQILEEAHINLFVLGILFLCLSALLIYSGLKDRTKIYFILSLGASGILYTFSDLLVLLLGREFAWLKLLLFAIFQLIILLSITIFFTAKKSNDKNGKKFIAFIIFTFALLNILFATMNFFIYAEKIGLSITQTSEYYLGNPEKFMKQKSIQGIIAISQIHFLPMAIYLLTLTHFLYLVNGKFNLTLTFSLFLTSLLDNISGIFILYLNEIFAIVKLISFILFEILLLLSSTLIIYRLITLKFNFPNHGHI